MFPSKQFNEKLERLTEHRAKKLLQILDWVESCLSGPSSEMRKIMLLAKESWNLKSMTFFYRRINFSKYHYGIHRTSGCGITWNCLSRFFINFSILWPSDFSIARTKVQVISGKSLYRSVLPPEASSKGVNLFVL